MIIFNVISVYLKLIIFISVYGNVVNIFDIEIRIRKFIDVRRVK